MIKERLKEEPSLSSSIASTSSSDVVQPEVRELLLLFAEIISLNTEGIDSERSVSSSSSFSDKHGLLTGDKDPTQHCNYKKILKLKIYQFLQFIFEPNCK